MTAKRYVAGSTAGSSLSQIGLHHNSLGREQSETETCGAVSGAPSRQMLAHGWPGRDVAAGDHTDQDINRRARRLGRQAASVLPFTCLLIFH